MMHDAKNRVRIGMVNFINTAPLYEIWKEQVREPAWQVVEDTPARLNRLLAEGAIDLGLVSSHEYAQAPEEYVLLPGLSISATGAVGSVFLFAPGPVEALGGKTVFLSPHSQTSNSLARVILEEFAGVTPCYEIGFGEDAPAGSAVVAIGDRALRLRRQGAFAHVVDLGECWQRHTNLPFVFALWAVRRDFARRAPATLARIHGRLLECVARGRERLGEISARVAPRIPMPEEDCRRYLERIEYGLDAVKLEALERFFGYLVERGEASPRSLPLRFAHVPA